MARIRSVHPGQWTDSKFLSCSPFCRLLVLAIRNESDDNGIFKWDPVEIKIRCLPLDNVDINALLDEAVQHGQLLKYEANNKEYGIIRNFQDWQRPKKPTFIYPIPTEPVGNGYRLNDKYVENHGQLNISNSTTSSPPVPHQSGNSASEGEKEEGGRRKGRGENGSRTLSPPTEQEVIDYFLENGFPKELAIRAYRGYNEANWCDSRGNKIKNWKQKMIHVWFKDDNKTGNNSKPSKLQRAANALRNARP